MKLVPRSSTRMRVISSTKLGVFRNHQQPKSIRLSNFLAATQSSCWFSRLSIVTKNWFLGKPPDRSESPRPKRSASARIIGTDELELGTDADMLDRQGRDAAHTG